MESADSIPTYDDNFGLVTTIGGTVLKSNIKEHISFLWQVIVEGCVSPAFAVVVTTAMMMTNFVIINNTITPI